MVTFVTVLMFLFRVSLHSSKFGDAAPFHRSRVVAQYLPTHLQLHLASLWQAGLLLRGCQLDLAVVSKLGVSGSLGYHW